MTATNKTFVIIGAGPTGLGTALRLQELGETDFVLLEAAPHAGGLAASVVDEKGFTWDLGGHVQFSHYEKFDEYMDLALGTDGWISHQRESWIWMNDSFVPYPFQNNLHRLPPKQRWQCVEGLIEAARRGRSACANFHDWIVSSFGTGIADLFLIPYNLKVWAYPAEQMSRQWVGERVAVPDLKTVMRAICLNEDQVSWGPNRTFRFPRRGGTGAVWRALASRVSADRCSYGSAVVAISPRRQEITTADGSRFAYRHLINTMPLDSLASLTDNTGLQQAASKLRYSSTHVVGIGLDGQPPEHLETKCWMYFPERNCPFYRVTVFSNYSPLNTPRPGATWSLMAEVAESPHKSVVGERIIDQVIEGMVATKLICPDAHILSKWYRRLEHGYPTPGLERDQVLDELLPALEQLNIYSRGRFGAWKYEVSNQDHCFMQGVEVADHIVCHRPEVTLHRPDEVNSGYNRFPYPEARAASSSRS